MSRVKVPRSLRSLISTDLSDELLAVGRLIAVGSIGARAPEILKLTGIDRSLIRYWVEA